MASSPAFRVTYHLHAAIWPPQHPRRCEHSVEQPQKPQANLDAVMLSDSLRRESPDQLRLVLKTPQRFVMLEASNILSFLSVLLGEEDNRHATRCTRIYFVAGLCKSSALEDTHREVEVNLDTCLVAAVCKCRAFV